MAEASEARRRDFSELKGRSKRGVAKAEAARRGLAKAHRAEAAIEERLARLARQDGRNASAAEHRKAAARERATASQLSIEESS
jgi:hypothetical protein